MEWGGGGDEEKVAIFPVHILLKLIVVILDKIFYSFEWTQLSFHVLRTRSMVGLFSSIEDMSTYQRKCKVLQGTKQILMRPVFLPGCGLKRRII